MHNSDVEDPLKELAEISVPDERSGYFAVGLAENHAILSSIKMSDNVPTGVRQLFETAKNLSLYSWYVYRFHQVSELTAFAAMEMALRLRYESENPNKKSPALAGLLKHAQSKGWIDDSHFPSRYVKAKTYAQHKKINELIESGKLINGEFDYGEATTDQEIENAISEMKIVDTIVKSAASIRNNLAHGSIRPHPNSISTLDTTAEVINIIFEIHDGSHL